MSQSELFPGFATHRIQTSQARDPLRRRRRRPAAPPAARLSADARDVAQGRAARSRDRFTVVCADLRGYGDSSKPDSDATHAAYSKRAMAPTWSS